MKPKKNLGQNFLTAPKIASFIAESADLSFSDTVLEIGPGKGILTSELLKLAGQVIAVEKDSALFENLEKKFLPEIASKKLMLLNQDILEFDLPKHQLENGQYKLVSNIPYNITGAILEKFIGGKSKPSLAVLLVQKEVAERIIARDGKESLLSISIKIFGQPKILRKVGAGSFFPKPQVDSAVILINNIKSSSLKNEPSEFFKAIKAGFAHRRKKLVSNLEPLGLDKIATAKKLSELGFNENVRAEELKAGDWLKLIGN